MKDLAVSILAFCLAVFLAGCSGSSPNEQPNTAPNGTSNVSTSDSSQYPLLAEKIANAEIEMLDGSITRVADRKGKVLLLNLWATWCGPCRQEMPHLVEMQEEFRDKDLQVLGLNVGEQGADEPETLETITDFTESIKVNYELARIPNSLTEEFTRLTKFGGVPQTILVDRDGRLRGVFLGGGSRVINTMKKSVEKVVNE